MEDFSKYTMPERMLGAAISAYDISFSNGVQFDPEAKYWGLVGANPSSVKPYTDGRHHLDAAFVAVTEDDWVVLSFRGTLSTYDNWDSFLAFLEDWLQDGETRPVCMTAGGQAIGNVEQGFLDALNALWNDLGAALDGIDWSSVKGIQITGHSKGAAMTFLAAAMIRVMYPAAREINVSAFAAPLAGQPDFAAWYRANQLGASTVRYQRMYDIVPFLPPSGAWDIFDNLGCQNPSKVPRQSSP